MSDNYLLCVAIDFGTAYSGYAFSFKSNMFDVRMNKDWGSNVSVTRYKTPTCVLTGKDDEFVAFGYEAHAIYTSAGKEENYHLFDRFKMDLYNEKNVSTSMTITSLDGHLLPAKTIIAMAIRYIKDHAFKRIESADIRSVTSDSIRWVITVPAIWSDKSKQLMRKAAQEAGIIDTEYSDNLLIALEPEAASLWCRSLPLSEFVDSQKGDVKMNDGTVYMVVDCGGGTIDITVHEVCKGGHIKEVEAASGGDWGGQYVDKKFEELLDNLFTQAVMKEFRTEDPEAWFRLLLAFDTTKRSQNLKEMQIQLPFSLLCRIVLNPKKITFEKRVFLARVTGVSTRGQEFLILNHEAKTKLFNDSIESIVSHIENLLEKSKAKSTKYMFLVGGFGECFLLQQRLKANFQSKMKFLVPNDAGKAVLKGAVLYGHRPSTLKSRIARKTYGESVEIPFIEGKHPISKKVTREGRCNCTDFFRIWIKKGEEVGVDECMKFNDVPATSNQTSVEARIYSTHKTDVQFVTDEGVEPAGILEIRIPDTYKSRESRKIETNVFFGRTEITVKFKDMSRWWFWRDEQETNIDFLSF